MISSYHLFLGLPITLCFFYILNSDLGSIQQPFSAIFHSVMLQFSVPISISFFVGPVPASNLCAFHLVHCICSASLYVIDPVFFFYRSCIHFLIGSGHKTRSQVAESTQKKGTTMCPDGKAGRLRSRAQCPSLYHRDQKQRETNGEHENAKASEGIVLRLSRRGSRQVTTFTTQPVTVAHWNATLTKDNDNDLSSSQPPAHKGPQGPECMALVPSQFGKLLASGRK